MPDSLPPNSLEAEQGVMGCLVLNTRLCLPEVVEQAGSEPEMFYDLRHQLIFMTIVKMAEQLKNVTVPTLCRELTQAGVLEQVGGAEYIGGLPDLAPSEHNLGYWLPVVKDKYLLRRMISACTSATAKLYEEPEDARGAVDEVERDILKAGEGQVTGTFSVMGDLIQGAIDTIEQYHARNGMLLGVPTGFTDLDKLTGGLRNGDMIVIAARPSIGKSSLALNICEHVALRENLPVGFFSLEMSKESLALRSVCTEARVNSRDIRDGFLADRDFPKLTSAAGRLKRAKLYIADVSAITIMELRARARRMVQQHGIRLLVVDYLQLMKATNSKGQRLDNREREISEISSGIKQLAKELQIPIIALSQLNRDLEKNKVRKPMLSDLRESGSIEQDADVVGLMYKPKLDDDDDEGDAVRVNLDIAKQRNGPTGIVQLVFIKGITKFESAAKIQDEP
jgi:replicative DNA helicase